MLFDEQGYNHWSLLQGTLSTMEERCTGITEKEEIIGEAPRVGQITRMLLSASDPIMIIFGKNNSFVFLYLNIKGSELLLLSIFITHDQKKIIIYICLKKKIH